MKYSENPRAQVEFIAESFDSLDGLFLIRETENYLIDQSREEPRWKKYGMVVLNSLARSPLAIMYGSRAYLP